MPESEPSTIECPFLRDECAEDECTFWIAGGCSLLLAANAMIAFSPVFIHWHMSHEHPRTHSCSDVGHICGAMFNASAVTYTRPLASILQMEFMHNEDMDGNGKVYKYDFDFYNDGTKPIALQEMRFDDSFAYNLSNVLITWESYVNWSHHGGPDPLS
jgi:hypothetical protein